MTDLAQRLRDLADAFEETPHKARVQALLREAANALDHLKDSHRQQIEQIQAGRKAWGDKAEQRIKELEKLLEEARK